MKKEKHQNLDGSYQSELSHAKYCKDNSWDSLRVFLGNDTHSFLSTTYPKDLNFSQVTEDD